MTNSSEPQPELTGLPAFDTSELSGGDQFEAAGAQRVEGTKNAIMSWLALADIELPDGLDAVLGIHLVTLESGARLAGLTEGMRSVARFTDFGGN